MLTSKRSRPSDDGGASANHADADAAETEGSSITHASAHSSGIFSADTVSGGSSSAAAASSPTASGRELAGASSPSGQPVDTALSPAAAAPVGPRKDYLSWEDFFMSVAFLSAMRSKDPSTQVGACIVDSENRIVGVGYNGFPRNIPDTALPWARHGATPLDTKYPFVCHAEMNCILNKNQASIKGCRLYVALFPCNECAKLIVQSGISEVVYHSDKYHEETPFVASRMLLDLAGVRYRQHIPKDASIVVTFGEP